jgi:UDP-N-acetylglucosamine--N-acetylmuramyl-(pentapeptide) pyrophosphoryl-undecaprenol N-acetylglucosamine transferase
MGNAKTHNDELNGLRLIIAGGGTGGHIFPGLAVGKELLRRYPASEVLFVTGDKKIENDILEDAGFARVSIVVEGIKGRGLLNRIKAIIKLPFGLCQSLLIIRRFSPGLVLGVGGYSAGPVCLAARILGVKTAIHEQNSYPGATNRLLSRFVDRIFISFPESKTLFPKDKVFLSGNPIREDFLTEDSGPEEASKGLKILVTGGSQGASAINALMIETLTRMKDKGVMPQVVHQTGRRDYDAILKGYNERGIEADIRPFIQDMSAAYRLADIVIGRAGAGTVFELAALGKPSILIPYPYAADDHQTANARMLGNCGGAKVIAQSDLNPDLLAEMLTGFMNDRASLNEMGRKAKQAAMPDAAKVIVDRIEEMIGVRMNAGTGRRAQGAGERQ